MFMGSTMKRILEVTEKVAEYEGIDSWHRNPIIKERIADQPYDTQFSVNVGEIHWNGEYRLVFNSRGQLLKAYSLRFADCNGTIVSDPILLPDNFYTIEES